jgi:hypothetical protein
VKLSNVHVFFIRRGAAAMLAVLLALGGMIGCHGSQGDESSPEK